MTSHHREAMYTIDKARQIFPDTQTADAVPAITARFKLLSAEDQLALIWFAYLEMGQTITVAAPGGSENGFGQTNARRNRLIELRRADEGDVRLGQQN